jgi:hypothetical protein
VFLRILLPKPTVTTLKLINMMKIFVMVILMIALVAIVGYLEDPCAAEGLMAGCAN